MTAPWIVERCAEAAYEMNRIYSEAIGDRSFSMWANAPEWQKTTVRNGVEGALSGNTPEQSHESWLREKVANGWVYGTEKDAIAKTHPCMVDFHALPASQRAKDALHIATVRAMAEALALGADLR